MHLFGHGQKSSGDDSHDSPSDQETPQNTQLNLAMELQGRAEVWQNIAQHQQEVAALLQRAAVRQRELIAQGMDIDDKLLEIEFRHFEEDLLRLVDSAFALEGLALRQVELAIRQTEDALHR